MPTVHREAGFRFQFYAADRPEPPHVHVVGSGGAAKIWLSSSVQVEHVRGYSRSERGRIIDIATAHRQGWLAAWRDYFAGA